MSQPYTVFLLYARDDAQHAQDLRGHLRPLENAGRIAVLGAPEMNPDPDWEQALSDRFDAADVVLPLVSAAFFAAAPARTAELKYALKRHRGGEAEVLPVIVRPCAYADDPLIGSLPVLPADGQPVTGSHRADRDAAWLDVVAGLKRALDRADNRRARPAEPPPPVPAAPAAATQPAALPRTRGSRSPLPLLAAGLVALSLTAAWWWLARPGGKNGDFPEMVAVKGGAFVMGCQGGRDAECFDDESPAHSITVSDFEIGRYEVTVRQFKAFIDESKYQTDADTAGGSYILTASGPEKGQGVSWRHDVAGRLRPETEYDHPVIHVSWNDAMAYCDWLGRKKGKRYRLPTEAEWEYAARGGRQSKGYQYAGSNDPDAVAWHYVNSGDRPLHGEWKLQDLAPNNCRTRPVGQKKPNELGLYDMSGNVWEWCWEWYGDYAASAQTDPMGPSTGSFRVYRGGSWFNGARYCRVSCRDYGLPDHRDFTLGFRVAAPLQ